MTPEESTFIGLIQDIEDAAKAFREALHCGELELGDIIRAGKHPCDIGGDAQDLAEVLDAIRLAAIERNAEDAAERIGYRDPNSEHRHLSHERA